MINWGRPSASPKTSRVGHPAESRQRHASVRVELHALRFQQPPLHQLAAGMSAAQADAAPRVDHAMPRHGGVLRERVQGVSHEAGLAGDPGEHRDVAVRGDRSILLVLA